MKAVAIVPVFNEAAHIGKLLARFPPAVCDAVIVDDGSTDGTTEEIRRHQFNVIRHEQRIGVGRCLQDGFDYALAKGYDVVVVMAGNGKDDPQEIPRLLDAIEKGADYVQGSRFLKGGEWKNLPAHRHFAIKALTWTWSLCTGHWLTDVTNGFRAYRTPFLRQPDIQWKQAWLQTYELEYYLHFHALRGNWTFREVPVSKNYPVKSNYSKIRPGRDWLKIITPLFLLMFRIRK